MKALKEKLKDQSGGKVLDVATGSGYFLSLLMDSFKDWDEMVGIDNCEPSKLETAKKRFTDEHVRIIGMDGSSMSFEDGFFDVVSISNSLHHLKDIKKTLEEMKRVLRPGGLFIVNEMYKDNQIEPQLTHVLMHHWWADIDSRLGIQHGYTLERQEIIEILKELNLVSLELFDDAELDIDYKDKAELEELSGVIDMYIDRAKDLHDFEALRAQGEELRKRLYDVGVASATQLLVIATK